MLLREKIKPAGPGEVSGSRWFSALKNSWNRLRSNEIASEDRLTLARFFDRQAPSPELNGLVETLRSIRKRLLANALLGSCTRWLVWLLIALIGVASISTGLAGAVIFLAVAAAIGVASILAWTWRNRPSRYETARRLDAAASLKDRVSTAVFLGGAEDRDGMIGEQRRDALARAGKIDAPGLFPVRLPGNYRSAFALVLLASALFAYRVHHRPPLLALLQSTARSQLVQSILSPVAHAMEKDLQRAMALLTKPDTAGEETQRPDSASNTEDLWKANDEKSANADDPKNQADAGEGDQQQDQMQAGNQAGNQAGDPSGDARQDDSYSQSQEGKNGAESSSDKAGEQSEQQGPEGRQSLGQSLMQALKNMMSNSPNQQSNNRAGQQPPNGQGTPQSGNSRQPGATDSDKKGESRGNSDAKQKATQTASEGAGSQQGTKELRKDQEAHPVNGVPDRVALEASGFKDDTRMKVPTETGTAQLGVQNVAPQQDAVINGAEQENIPARYRFYVQRYFEHADNGKH